MSRPAQVILTTCSVHNKQPHQASSSSTRDTSHFISSPAPSRTTKRHQTTTHPPRLQSTSATTSPAPFPLRQIDLIHGINHLHPLHSYIVTGATPAGRRGRKEEPCVAHKCTSGLIDQNLDQIVQKYLHSQGIQQLPMHENNQEVEMYQEVVALKEAIGIAEQNMRHYLAEDLEPLPLDELHKHEQQLESSLALIRARKNQLMHQQLENLRKKEQMLQTDNGHMYRWLMGAGQEQLELPFFGEDQPSSSTVLQLATSSSSSQFYPYRLPSTHPNLQNYE